jgi:isoleucyl-tRNA synthetase
MEAKYPLNLPNTTFPMRAGAATREPELQAFWDSERVYARNLKERPKGMFVMHDGPPYLSAPAIHMGTALNKVLKDIVVKYKTLQGYQSPFVPGYDSHGLPIENAALKALNKRRSELSPIELRQRSAEFALTNLPGMQDNFKRLGVLADWANPYVTLKPEYEAAQLRVFGTMVEKGYIYQGFKPVFWSTYLETALADAEVEYADVTSDSVYVRFPLDSNLAERVPGLPADLGRVDAVIWTTTPWTLPANYGISVNPEFDYDVVRYDQGTLLLAQALRESVEKAVELTGGTVIASCKGTALDKLTARHPFLDRQSLIMLGDHVTAEAGTGLVHTAPAHGHEDFAVGKLYGLPVQTPVDAKGVYDETAGPFAGEPIDQVNGKIIERLTADGLLLKASKMRHSYPHDWRLHKPVIIRATQQWFASVDNFRSQALDAVKATKWYPEAGENRIGTMIENRSDWCISRQRVWGVPIPAFYCEACEATLLTAATVEHVAAIVASEGSDAWWIRPTAELMPAGTACQCGGTSFRKETDIMDVWFDSGTSWSAVLEQRQNNAPHDQHYPADLYLEGSDQHRGWFQSSLLTSVATRGRAPYKQVVTHGFVLDGNGRKMSKSVGNVVAPQQVIDKCGADVLRLWAASVDYTGDVRVSDAIINQLSDIYRKIRNTVRFLLGNLNDFDPATDAVAYEKLGFLDQYALVRLQDMLEAVTQAYETYDFTRIYQLLQNYCVVDLSNTYLDTAKDVLYVRPTAHPERRATQTAMFHIMRALTGMVAPVLSHLAEDIWQHLPAALRASDKASVFLTDFPQINAAWQSGEVRSHGEQLYALRETVTKALELAREAKTIGSSLEAKVTLFAETPEAAATLERSADLLSRLFIVSQVERVASALPSVTHSANGLQVAVSPADGSKCGRCWHLETSVGQNATYADLCAPCVDVVTAG